MIGFLGRSKVVAAFFGFDKRIDWPKDGNMWSHMSSTSFGA